MIEWVKTPELSIFFNKVPNIILREPAFAKNKFELLSIKTYPLRNLEPVKCVIFDKLNFKKYSFVIPKMNYDGASIPKFIWFLVGSNTDAFYKIPSLIHDVICDNHSLIDNDRKLSTEVFKQLLLREGVSKFKANLMCNFVNFHQKHFCNWKGNDNG